MSTHLPNWLHTELSQHWKNGRPDQRIMPDDLYYLDLAKVIFDYLSILKTDLPGLNYVEKDIAELAYIIAAWFEDFICEMGPWKVFQDRNLEVCGAYIPFLNLEGYDPDYINWQDINFLIWLWFRKMNKGKFAFPNASWMRDLAEEILEELEESIDGAPATTLYDEFLTITPTDDFFAIRVRLAWISQSCYLFGKLDMNSHIKETILAEQKAIEKRGRTFDMDMLNDVVITTSFNDHFRLGNWRVNEIAARLLHTEENIRQQLSAMSTKHEDEFYLEAVGETHYTLRPIEFDIKIPVLKRSGDIRLGDGRYVFCSLVKFAGEYWINGLISQGRWKDGDDDFLDNAETMRPEIYRTKIEQDNFAEAMEIQALVFQAQFDGLLHIAPNADAAEQSIEKFSNEVQRRLFERFGSGKAGLDIKPVSLASHRDREQAIGIFYVEQKAIFISTELPLVVDFLEGKSNAGESRAAFFTIFSGLPRAVSKYLAQHYSMDRLAWEGTAGWDIRSNAEALGWFLAKR